LVVTKHRFTLWKHFGSTLIAVTIPHFECSKKNKNKKS